jgi:hypothetical protein
VNNVLQGQLRGTKGEVRDLLRRFPDARNNDFYLQWLYLQYYCGIDLPFLNWEKLEEISGRLETVRRVRQKIQNDDGEFLPTDPLILARRIAKMKKYRA